MHHEIIKILTNEHKNILEFVGELKKKCLIFMEDDYIDIGGFYSAVDFIKSYADWRHHRKEEELLFSAMTAHLGDTAEQLIKHGMLVEHDMARFQVCEMEKWLKNYEANESAENKLNIIANTMSYCALLERHAQKEDEVVYPYAVRSLPEEVMNELDSKVLEYEKAYD